MTATGTLFEFKLPDVGEGIHEGELLAWLVNVGDSVSEDTPLAEFMTDKVTVELPSPLSGTIKALHGKVGDTLYVGNLLVEIEVGDAVANATVATPSSAEAASLAVSAPTSTSSKTCTAKTAAAVMSVASAPAPVSVPSPAVTAVTTPPTALGNVLAAPATRALARELGLLLEDIHGTGSNGRITPEDVHRHHRALGAPLATATAASSIASATAPAPMLEDTQIPYQGIRKTIGQRLGEVKRSVPEFAFVEAINITKLEALRKELNLSLKEENLKLTVLPFILKAVTLALASVPQLNASLNEAQGIITQFASTHLSIAVDTPQGLVVPVLRSTHTQGIIELAQGLQALSQKAREGKLTPNDQQGGTFTVSSIGSIGGLFGVPILNAPQAGILAVGKATKQPVVNEAYDSISVGYVMHVCLTADHRVVDGADAARFMNRLKHLLEHPTYLLAL